MAYYKVREGQLVLCPVNCTWQGPAPVWQGEPLTGLEEGASVLNYNLLPGPVLEGQGWRPALIDDSLPEYDPGSQELIPWYEDCGTYVARRWKVADLPQPTPEQMAQALEILGVNLEGEGS